MAATDAVVDPCSGVEIAHATFQNARRLSLDLVGKLIRPLVPPFHARLFADDAHLLSVHGARIDGARPDGGDSTVVVFHQRNGIVFKGARLLTKL